MTPPARQAWLSQLEPDGTVLRASLRRLRLAFAILASLAAVNAWIVLVVGGTGRVIGVVGLVLVGLAAGLMAARGILKLPLYGVDRQGLHLPRLGLLPWTAIAELRWERYRAERWIGIVPYDGARLRRLGRLRRLAGANVRLGYAPLQLDPRQVGLEPAELQSLLEQYLPGVRISGEAR